MSERITGHAKTLGLPSFPCLLPHPCSVLAPWASEPEVKWAQEEIELFHLNFWSSQGGFL